MTDCAPQPDEPLLWRTAGIQDEALVHRWSRQFGVPVRVARWLVARGMPEHEVPSFLEPERQPFSSPYDFLDMAGAVDRIQRAIRRGEKIVVVGDYDVDGVTATAIVTTALRSLGGDVEWILPHRVDDGYGLTTALVDRARSLGAGLLVTVDNGIRAGDAVAYAAAHGLDVIVTDHHEPGPPEPRQALAVVHWSRAANPFAADLSGAGVAWKLAVCLLDTLGGAGDEDAALRLWLMGLAALGAIADVMPMRRENRRLVQAGLAVLRACRRPGWLALCQAAGIAPESLTDVAVAWQIAPRLNAAGRMDRADVALALLMADDPEEALAHASMLERLNDERRAETDRAVAEAARWCREAIMQGAAAGAEPAGLVVAGPWKLGVAGIVAAKLVEEFDRPVIVLADDGDEVLRGSGRAPNGVPLHDVVAACAACLMHFGGHDAAVGLALARDALPEFRRTFADAVAAALGQVREASLPIADDYLPLSEVTLDTWRWIERFRPFGAENPELVFYVGPVRVREVAWMGAGQCHAKVWVEEGGAEAELVWFHAPDHVRQWRPGCHIAAVASLERNDWQGHTRVQLRVVRAQCIDAALTKDEFGAIYRLLRARRRLRLADTEPLLPHRAAAERQLILDTFVELGFARRAESAYHVNEQVSPRDLRDSRQYQRHLRRVGGALQG